MTRFLVLRHRETSDCHEENEKIKKCLDRYKFGTRFVDKTGTKCDNIATECDNTANKNCNIMFCLVVEDSEYHRLLETVYRELQPKILSIYSMNDFVKMHAKSLDTLNTQTVECQTTSIETCDKDAETDEQQFADAENQTEVANCDKATDIDQILVSNDSSEPSYQEKLIIKPPEPLIMETQETSDSASEELLNCEETQEPSSFITVKTEVQNVSQHENQNSPLSNNNNNRSETSSIISTSSSRDNYFDCPVPTKKMRVFSYSSFLYNSVECTRCLMQLDPDNREEISQHVIEEHLKYKRYQCRLCLVKYSLLKECTDHLQVEHPNMLDINKIFTDNINEKYLDEVSRITKCTFPELFKRSKPVNMSDVIVGMTKEAELSVFPEI